LTWGLYGELWDKVDTAGTGEPMGHKSACVADTGGQADSRYEEKGVHGDGSEQKWGNADGNVTVLTAEWGDAHGSEETWDYENGSQEKWGDADSSEQKWDHANGSEEQWGDAEGSEQKWGDAEGSEQKWGDADGDVLTAEWEDANGSEQKWDDPNSAEQWGEYYDEQGHGPQQDAAWPGNHHSAAMSVDGSANSTSGSDDFPDVDPSVSISHEAQMLAAAAYSAGHAAAAETSDDSEINSSTEKTWYMKFLRKMTTRAASEICPDLVSNTVPLDFTAEVILLFESLLATCHIRVL
jgi:hypothetical protein